MKINNSTISRDYIFSNKDLKKLLKIKGDIQSIGLWRGLSPNQQERGVSEDKVEWEIVTHEDITKKELSSKHSNKSGGNLQ